MTRAIRFARTGGPEVLTLEEIPLPEPKAGEALVRHRAIGVNFIDTYQRTGLYPVPLPSGLGSEAAGVVEKLGEGVTTVRVGERVAYVASGAPAAYSDARTIAADRLIPLPDEISDEVAAASLLKGMTAEFLIHRTFAVKRGQTVLWHAAAGGVGLIACQWLNALGARVIPAPLAPDQKAELCAATAATKRSCTRGKTSRSACASSRPGAAHRWCTIRSAKRPSRARSIASRRAGCSWPSAMLLASPTRSTFCNSRRRARSLPDAPDAGPLRRSRPRGGSSPARARCSRSHPAAD